MRRISPIQLRWPLGKVQCPRCADTFTPVYRPDPFRPHWAIPGHNLSGERPCPGSLLFVRNA